ncbi:hypothetical protein GBAR_LOCUS5832 [Geodia barretti]|uniref:CARD domain-containing protein n=1 Tax=Geodia barretti TaxID=519541 RepID=A0AA35RD93_GEOBA|nr:hypothetical protein GBAR_LOCUS5832 [Geodia barretti]
MSISQRRRSSVTREVINANAPLILRQMDLGKVAQAVSEVEGMLTPDQVNRLYQRFTPEEERKAQLLEWVCQKGDQRRDQFLKCLCETGHEELASQLQEQFDSQLQQQ